MVSNRHEARLAVMKTIFTLEYREKGQPEDVLNYMVKEFHSSLTDLTFAKELLSGVLAKKTEIFDVIQTEAPQWPVDRIAPVDRAILEIGCYEILFSKDVPAVVAINEGVEVAKEYGDLNSARFINGVLSTVMHKYRPDAETKPKEETEETADNEEKTVNKESNLPENESI